MTAEQISLFAARHWRDALEIAILTVGIYGLWTFVRGTRGAKLLFGLAGTLLVLLLAAHLLELRVLGWVFRSLAMFVAFALVVLFQPELRRALTSLGSHRLLSLVTQD